LWLKRLEQRGGGARVVLAVWPNHWAGALWAKSAAKVARKAATEAVKKPAAGKAIAAMKPADGGGDAASGGPAPAAPSASAVMEKAPCFWRLFGWMC
jgi:hypothetical protein